MLYFKYILVLPLTLFGFRGCKRHSQTCRTRVTEVDLEEAALRQIQLN